jgi:hypothetical protein
MGEKYGTNGQRKKLTAKRERGWVRQLLHELVKLLKGSCHG